MIFAAVVTPKEHSLRCPTVPPVDDIKKIEESNTKVQLNHIEEAKPLEQSA
jgi:hypothetical protein